MPERGSAPEYTVAEFAERHRLCTATVYRQVRSGGIKAVRIGRSIRIPELTAPDQPRPEPAQ